VSFYLFAQAAHDAKEHVLGNSAGVATFEFFAVAMVVTSQGLETVGLGAQKLFGELFEFHLAKVFDLGPEVMVPQDKGGFGDTDFVGDALEAPIAGAEFDEFVFGFGGVHGG
jgi:hypothetical protein